MKRILFLLALSIGLTVLSYQQHLPSELPVSFVHQPRQTPMDGLARLTLGKKISINQADVSDLLALPGIGPGRAAAIIDWRDRYGPFAQAEDLLKVPGIGHQTFRHLESLIEITSLPKVK